MTRRNYVKGGAIRDLRLRDLVGQDLQGPIDPDPGQELPLPGPELEDTESESTTMNTFTHPASDEIE